MSIEIQVHLKLSLSSSEYLQKYLTNANKLCSYKTMKISVPYCFGPIWKAFLLSTHLCIHLPIHLLIHPSILPSTQKILIEPLPCAKYCSRCWRYICE